MMNVFDVSQNTDAWLKWRDTGLGASDAATILGINPFQTPFGLWEILTGRKLKKDLSKNPLVIRGNILEALALATAEKYIGKKLKPLCASETNNPFILSSFDGITECKKIVCEVKCPHENTFANVLLEGKKSMFYLIYWVQVQQQLYVSKANKGFLVFFLKGKEGEKNKLLPFEIYPDVEFQEKKLIPGLKRFWNFVKKDIPPPRNTELDPCVVDEKLWSTFSQEFNQLNLEKKRLKEKLSLLEEKLNPLQDQLVSLMGNNSLAESDGLRVKRFEKQGKVNYSKLIEHIFSISSEELNKLNKDTLLSNFREKSIEQVKFTSSHEDELKLEQSSTSEFIL